MAAVLAANFARLQESLRSLEEFGKLLDPGWPAVQATPLSHYTLQRPIDITRGSIERLADGQALRVDRRPAVGRGIRAAGRVADRGRRPTCCNSATNGSATGNCSLEPVAAGSQCGQAASLPTTRHAVRSSTTGPTWPRWPAPTASTSARRSSR